MAAKQVVEIAGKRVQLTNLDKLLWPRAGLTKAHLLEYYASLYPYIHKHWEGRALTVTRYPHGVEGEFFFQKNKPTSAPPWIISRRIGEVDYIVATDLAVIIWLANSGAIEFHPSTYLADNPESPSYAIIDLDPTPPLGIKEAVEVAKHCRELLDKLSLKGYPKFSGASGVHIYIPLEPNCDFNLSAELIKQIGTALKGSYPAKITLERLIKNRRGVYVDYLQNSQSRTMVGVYSPRPTPEATVSTPVSWEDLDYYQPRDFTVKTVPQWVQERGDLFSGVVRFPQSLEHLIFSQPRA